MNCPFGYSDSYLSKSILVSLYLPWKNEQSAFMYRTCWRTDERSYFLRKASKAFEAGAQSTCEKRQAAIRKSISSATSGVRLATLACTHL